MNLNMKKVRETKNVAYVPIYDPISFRRHVLLSNIEVISLLEKYELLKQIRNEKKKAVVELKTKLLDLIESSSSLKNLFPSVSKRELKKESREIEEKVEKIKYPKKSEGYRHLQRELQDLQDKLSKLNI